MILSFLQFTDKHNITPSFLFYRLEKHDVTSYSELAQIISLSATTIASLYGASVDVTSGYAALPWLLGAGVLLQFYAARCFYASGVLSKMFICLVFAVFWMAWSALIIWGRCWQKFQVLY